MLYNQPKLLSTLESKLTFKKHINETLHKAYFIQKKLYPFMIRGDQHFPRKKKKTNLYNDNKTNTNICSFSVV